MVSSSSSRQRYSTGTAPQRAAVCVLLLLLLLHPQACVSVKHAQLLLQLKQHQLNSRVSSQSSYCNRRQLPGPAYTAVQRQLYALACKGCSLSHRAAQTHTSASGSSTFFSFSFSLSLPPLPLPLPLLLLLSGVVASCLQKSGTDAVGCSSEYHCHALPRAAWGVSGQC